MTNPKKQELKANIRQIQDSLYQGKKTIFDLANAIRELNEFNKQEG